MSLAVIVGATGAVSLEGQRGGPPSQGQARGQSAKPQKPPTPRAEAPTPPVKGPQAVGQQLVQKPKLAARVQLLLPPNTDLQLASAGFKNLGQFVAAAHVSNNLSIPFDQLKLRLTGTDPKSLGQAIQELKPTVNATAEVKRAEAQAKKDLEGRDR